MADKFMTAPVYPIHHLPSPNRKLPTREAVREIMAQELQDREQQVREKRAAERRDFVANHPLVRGHEPKCTGNSTIDTLNQVKYQLAREAASLEFTRTERDLRGLDTSQVSSRIVSAWKQVVSVELDIRKQGVTVLDPNSEEMQRVFKMWIETLRDIMTSMVKEDVLPTEVMDLFFSKFSAAMEGWEGRLE
jgi:hypothetical protein